MEICRYKSSDNVTVGSNPRWILREILWNLVITLTFFHSKSEWSKLSLWISSVCTIKPSFSIKKLLSGFSKELRCQFCDCKLSVKLAWCCICKNTEEGEKIFWWSNSAPVHIQICSQFTSRAACGCQKLESKGVIDVLTKWIQCKHRFKVLLQLRKMRQGWKSYNTLL